jgi:hypothetical protein
MELPREPDVNDPWQLLRLNAQILANDIRRAREQMTWAQGHRTRIAVLEQAERAQQRALRALSSLIYP